MGEEEREGVEKGRVSARGVERPCRATSCDQLSYWEGGGQKENPGRN